MCHGEKSEGKTDTSPAMAHWLTRWVCLCILPHHLCPLDLILNKQNYINRVLISGQSVLLRNQCFRMCKALCFVCSLICSIKVCWLGWLRRCPLALLIFLQSVNHMESESPGYIIFAQILMTRVKLTLILFQIHWFTTYVD